MTSRNHLSNGHTYIDVDPVGEWAVCNSLPHWAIVNKRTLRTVTIGPVGGRVNHFDRAVEEAKARNKALGNGSELPGATRTSAPFLD